MIFHVKGVFYVNWKVDVTIIDTDSFNNVNLFHLFHWQLTAINHLFSYSYSHIFTEWTLCSF